MDMDQVSLTGDAIAAVVLGCVGTGQGLGDGMSSVKVDERSLNWRAEPVSQRATQGWSVERRAMRLWDAFRVRMQIEQGPEAVAAGRCGK